MAGIILCLLSLLLLNWVPTTTSQFFPFDLSGQPSSSLDVSQFPAAQPKTPPFRVFPGMPNYPTIPDFLQMAEKLDGDIISGMQEPYMNATLMHNIRAIKLPYIHVMVESLEDVQVAINFSRTFNLMVAVKSSGHSYIGRSTYDGALVINMEKMKKRTINLNSARNPAGEITLETGNSWLEVYSEVDQIQTQDDVGNVQRRVVVGGSAHTVAMGGYTQGGGHSPMCRQLGMAVDNLLEATVVLADGRKAVVSEEGMVITDLEGTTTTTTNDTSLFWAIRGGGGGTWGVIVDFTFKLHYAPARFRRVALAWALSYQGADIGSDTLKFVVGQLAQLSGQWGGYMLVSGAQLDANSMGSLTLFLNHFGTDQDASNQEVDALLNHNTYSHQYVKHDITYPTFLEYEVTAQDPPTYYTYVFNTFVQPSIANNSTQLDELADFLMDSQHPVVPQSSISCTGALIGGKMSEVRSGETPVHPSFRSGLMSLTCSVSFPEGLFTEESLFDGYARQMRDRLAALGDGHYFNECAEDLDDWKSEFWGMDNYNRLLTIKHLWDPNHFFWCHNCVGSDEVSFASGFRQ